MPLAWLRHVATSIQTARDSTPASNPLQSEGTRIVGALVALLALALILAAGLLWREHSRAQPRAATAVRAVLR